MPHPRRHPGRHPRLIAVAALVLVGACAAPSYDDAVPALGQTQTAQDRLPSGIGGVAADSTRYLGGTQVAEYWVGTDGEQICLVQSLRATRTLGSSCADADEFTRSGVVLTTASGGVSATGLLVPAGFDPADAPGSEQWAGVADNLLAPAGEGEPPAP